MYLALGVLFPSRILFSILHIRNMDPLQVQGEPHQIELRMMSSYSVVLNIGDVGGGRIQGNPEQVELQGLFLSLVGSISASLSVCGGHLWLEEALDLLNLLPWLGSLFGCAVVVGRLQFC